jgi:HSP20 family protein
MAKELTKEQRSVVPPCNICEENGMMVVRLEMPGVAKDGLSVNVDGDTLTVAGNRAQAEDGKFLIRERRVGDYRAVYTLDERINRDKIEAKMENGILTLNLNLKDEVKPRKIAVKTK